MDLRTGLVTCGGPEDLLAQMAAAQLGHAVGLPVSIGTFATGSKASDWQAGVENGLSGFASLVSGADMCSGAGLLYAARTFSNEQMLLDADAWGLLASVGAGLPLADEDSPSRPSPRSGRPATSSPRTTRSRTCAGSGSPATSTAARGRSGTPAGRPGGGRPRPRAGPVAPRVARAAAAPGRRRGRARRDRRLVRGPRRIAVTGHRIGRTIGTYLLPAPPPAPRGRRSAASTRGSRTMPTVATSVPELLGLLDGIVRIEGGRLVVVDEVALRGDGIRDVAWTATFSEDAATVEAARWIVWEASQELGARSASIQGLYDARARGEVAGFTVPAINLRAQTFDMARVIFETAPRQGGRAGHPRARAQRADVHLPARLRVRHQRPGRARSRRAGPAPSSSRATTTSSTGRSTPPIPRR